MKLALVVLALAVVLGVCHAEDDPTTSLTGVADLSEAPSLCMYFRHQACITNYQQERREHSLLLSLIC